MKFLSFNLYLKDEKMRCFSCKVYIAGIGDIEMRDFPISDQTINQLEKEIEMQIIKRLGRDFGEVFNAKEAIHTTGNKKEEVLPMQQQGSSSVANMLGQKPIPTNMSQVRYCSEQVGSQMDGIQGLGKETE